MKVNNQMVLLRIHHRWHTQSKSYIFALDCLSVGRRRLCVCLFSVYENTPIRKNALYAFMYMFVSLFFEHGDPN